MGSDPVLVSSSAPLSELIDALREALWRGGPAVFCYDSSKPAVLHGPVPAEAAVVVETSGTTGTPKQVWLSKDAILSSARTTSRVAGAEGLWWLALPTHYIAGLQVVVRSLLAGYEPVVSPQGFDTVSKLRDVLPELRETTANGVPLYCSLVPTQLAQLVDAVEAGELEAHDLSLFARILVGGQRIDTSLLARAHAVGVVVTRTYGAAETGGGCVWDGEALDEVSIDIVDGRVAISGPMLAGGYLGDDTLSGEAFIEREGKRWFLSRDLGSIDDGHLVVNGRMDDVIVSGAVKVSLHDVERVMREQAGVSDAIVVSATDSQWGEVPVVVTTHQCDLEQLRVAAKEALGPAAQPRSALTLEGIPLLPSGKPDRRAITELVTRRLTYDE
jgi:O-succinylbenzoic acid--CoA ligase